MARWSPGLVALTLVALGLVGPARAEIMRADLRVDGMSCPFCAFGIEKKLLDVDGVTGVEVMLDEGRLRLQLATGNRATPAALEQAVEKAGFELAGLRLEVRGRLEASAEETWVVAHDELRFRLRESEGDAEAPLSPSLRESLRADEEGRVVVSGRVAGPADAPRLVVELPPGTRVGGS